MKETHPTPHPLAVEAASQVINGYVENVQDYEERDIANRIHTIALEPVLRAGDRLYDLAYHDPDCPLWAGRPGICNCGLEQALTAWRILTAPNASANTATKPPSLAQDEPEAT